MKEESVKVKSSISKPHPYEVRLSEMDDVREFFSTTDLSKVTRFFRQEALFGFIDGIVVPQLLRMPGKTVIKAWSAGCSKGKETYSLAMTLISAVKRAGSNHNIEVVGTDVARTSIKEAAMGRYEITKKEKIRHRLLSDYFDFQENGVITAKEYLKKSVRFKVHNLLRGSGLSNMDIIICNQVLLYYDKRAKSRILSHLVRALSQGGYLFVNGAGLKGLKAYGFERESTQIRVFRRKDALFAGDKADAANCRG